MHWNLRCLLCPYRTTDLVAMQEHAMDQHGATVDDVRTVSKVEESVLSLVYFSKNDLVRFSAKKVA